MENLNELNQLVKELELAEKKLEHLNNINQIIYINVNSFENSRNDINLTEDESTEIVKLMIELCAVKVDSLRKKLSKFKIKKKCKDTNQKTQL